MTPQEIIEGNKLIAEFMGRKGKVNAHLYWVNIPSVKWVTIEQMQFHTSWDWLMHVVEKVEFLSGHLVEIELMACTIKNIDLTWVHTSQGSSKIEAVWLACVSFIKWYNQNKPI